MTRQWFLPELLRRIKNALGPDYPVTTDVSGSHGAWLAVPVFAAARVAGRDILKATAAVAEQLRAIGGIEVLVSGGYVNVIPQQLEPILAEAADPAFGNSAVGQNQTVLIEFSSPNIAKPMSVGHLRSTIIGDALVRLYRALGYRVTGINHLGDWGTQFGKLLVAYQDKYGDLKPRSKLRLTDLLDLYVGFHAATDRDPDLNEAARAMFRRLEDGEPAVRRLWQSLVRISLTEFQKIYARLGVKFDEPALGESSYADRLPKLLARARRKSVAEESDGALVIRLPKHPAPLLIQKRDGATLYATRDLAAIEERVRQFSPAQILYVVGNDQSLHFEQVFAAARRLDPALEKTELAHVKFGLVRVPEGKMSTRRGRVVFLDDVLDEAVKRARGVVETKNPNLSAAQKDRVAEAVGLGAVKYFDLSRDRRHDIVFDWNRMLALSGDSGPYLQYTYVRAAQILVKSGVRDGISSGVTNGLSRGGGGAIPLPGDTQRLVRDLARFPLVIIRAAENRAPHTLAQYLNRLAADFNRFYEAYPVLKAADDDRAFRLAIVAGAANVLRRGLNLLGIETLEKM